MKAERKNYRIPRTEPRVFLEVLRVINGEIREDLKSARLAEVVKALSGAIDEIMRCCASIEGSISRANSPDIDEKERLDHLDQAYLHTRALQVEGLFLEKRATKGAWYAEGLDWEFSVTLAPGTEPEPFCGHVPAADRIFIRKSSIVPIPDDWFEQLYWDFFVGLNDVDDLRRLRKCDGYHKEPYYFVTIKVQQQNRYFCSDKCRKHFHNNKDKKSKEGVGNHGRQRQTTKKGR